MLKIKEKLDHYGSEEPAVLLLKPMEIGLYEDLHVTRKVRRLGE